MEPCELAELKKKARQIRVMTLEAIGGFGRGHVGGTMSIVEVLTALYYRHMNVDPSNPRRKDRDRLVLSKGHAGPVLYSVLADKGYFPKDWLCTLNREGTHLPCHVDMNLTPGVDMSSGSLGQGLSVAVGMALGYRLDGLKNTIYCIISDGETDEGQIWEAAMAAAHYGLTNLIAFTDDNKLSASGYTREVMNLGDLGAKWEAFGWFVQPTNGHDLVAIDVAIERAKKEGQRPSMIILDTVKAKGVRGLEGIVQSHFRQFDRQAAQEAIAGLEE